MTLKPAIPVAGVLFALVTTGTTPIHALSCALPEVVVPSPDAVHVPTNTLVWCSNDPQRPAAPIQLTDASGAAVSGSETLISLPWLDVLIFHPDVELAPNSQYTVECPIRWEGQTPTHVFTTGPGSRSTPPVVPSVANVSVAAVDSGWGPSYHARFLGAAEAQTISIIDIGGTATLSPDLPSGAVSDADFNFGFSDVYVGNGPCMGNWGAAGLGASTSVRLGAFDMTGAFSGWSETVTVTIPSELSTPVQDDEGSTDPPDADPDGVVSPDEDDAIAEELDAPTVGDDATTSSSTSGSGCALGAADPSPWGAAGLLGLTWLGAGRRRSRQTRRSRPT